MRKSKAIPLPGTQEAVAASAERQANNGIILAAMPALNSEFAQIQQQVIQQAFIANEKGELTPDKAKDFWCQMFAVAHLQRRLSTKASLNAAEAQRIMNQGAKPNG